MAEKSKGNKDIELSKLKLNDKNPRTITGEMLKKLKRSIEDFPEMMELREIVVDENMVVLGGNMRVRALRDMGYTTVPASWVKISSGLDEEKKGEFVIKDNIGFGEWDMESIANEWPAELLAIWGFPVPVGWDEERQKDDDFYTQKIESPVYEPGEEKPSLMDLTDTTKYDELITEINSAKISMQIKKFLQVAATRHVVFNYQRIADYYAHASKEVQGLMEKNALVIIDFDKAIEYGFVKISKQMGEIFDDDYE